MDLLITWAITHQSPEVFNVPLVKAKLAPVQYEQKNSTTDPASWSLRPPLKLGSGSYKATLTVASSPPRTQEEAPSRTQEASASFRSTGLSKNKRSHHQTACPVRSVLPYPQPNNAMSTEGNQRCWGHSSVLEPSPRMCKALGSIPSTTKTIVKPLCFPLNTRRVKIPI